MQSNLLNLALLQKKQLKIQNKIQLHKYKYKLTYKCTLLPSWTWRQQTIA